MMEQFSDSYALSAEAQTLMAQLIESCEEFGHLEQARIACVASQREPMLRSWPCHAFVAEPRVQGPCKFLFDWLISQFTAPLFGGEDSDFIVIIDAALWPSWSAEYRERVVYHELCHIVAREDENGIEKRGDDGRILLRLKPHDYEFFEREVQRYGPELCELDSAAKAIADGYRAAERRKRRVA